MGILRVSHSFNFEKKINSFCKATRYQLDEMGEDFAFIAVQGADCLYPVVIRDIEDVLLFSISINVPISEDDEIPHLLSTFLLQLNADTIKGFWSLEEDEDDNLFYTYNHISPKLFVNKQRFDEIIDDLILNFEIFMKIPEMEEEFDEDIEFEEDLHESEDTHRHEH